MGVVNWISAVTVMALIVLFSCSSCDERERRDATLKQLKMLSTGLEIHKVIHEKGYPESLEDLSKTPRDFTDAWGRPYVYKASEDRGTYTLFSLGPDGRPRTEDDLELQAQSTP